MITFGTIIRNFRLGRNLSQSVVATAIGIEQSTYCRIESDILEPKAKTLWYLAAFYEVEVTTFYPPLFIKFSKTQQLFNQLLKTIHDKNLASISFHKFFCHSSD